MKRKKKQNNSIIGILFVLIVSIGIIIFLENSYFNSKKEEVKENKVDNKVEKKETNNNNNKIENSTSSSSDNIQNTKEENKTISEPAKTEKEENKQENENKNNVTINLELIGEEEITINKDDKFVDPGAKATDSNGKDVTSQIKVDNAVNTSKEGTYTITYSIGNSIVMRYVIVK